MRYQETCLALRPPILRAAVWFCRPTSLGGATTNTGSHDPSALNTSTTLLLGQQWLRRTEGAGDGSDGAAAVLLEAVKPLAVDGCVDTAGERFSETGAAAGDAGGGCCCAAEGSKRSAVESKAHGEMF